MPLALALPVLALALGQPLPPDLRPASPDRASAGRVAQGDPSAPAWPAQRAESAQAAPAVPTAPPPRQQPPPPPEQATPPSPPAFQLSEPAAVPLQDWEPGPAVTYPLVAPGAPALPAGRLPRCLVRQGGARYRAQCDDTTRTCLVAPDAELSADGEPRAPLDRAPPCVGPALREEDLASRGYALVFAVADAPPGWRRDERQRVMQVNFDLDRRIWLGAGYAGGSFPWTPGAEGTTGIRLDLPFLLPGRVQGLARVRALESHVALDGSMADVLVLGLDATKAYPSPLLRITTFVGRPRRFDPPLYLGVYAEGLRTETLHLEDGRWYDRLSGGLWLTADLWRSRDLSSFARLRGGAGIEKVDQLEGDDWTPGGGADAEVMLDGSGFHHLRASVLAEAVLRTGDAPLPAGLARHRSRLTARAEYEVILLAVNDQPLSAVLDVRAQERDDVPAYPTTWRWQATAGLRFNLWAPPRRTAAPQEKL